MRQSVTWYLGDGEWGMAWRMSCGGQFDTRVVQELGSIGGILEVAAAGAVLMLG